MANNTDKFEEYFAHLRQISAFGRIYKKFVSSPVLYFCARKFGDHIIEIGSGTGSGVLGAFPRRVQGLEINPHAVEYCVAKGLTAQLIRSDGIFPFTDGECDVCVLDNVLEHIDDPQATLNECYRITKKNGGLVVAVPGLRGFESDDDHKKFYDAEKLRLLDKRWLFLNMFSIPFFFKSEMLSKTVKQYCLVATYKKL